MGAIHDGHLSLVKKSIEICQTTIVSIYLNPTQFSLGEDLDKYPKTIESDLKKLSHFQVDCVFLLGAITITGVSAAKARLENNTKIKLNDKTFNFLTI